MSIHMQQHMHLEKKLNEGTGKTESDKVIKHLHKHFN